MGSAVTRATGAASFHGLEEDFEAWRRRLTIPLDLVIVCVGGSMHPQEVEAYDSRSTQVQVLQAPAVLQAIDATSTHATAALQAQPLHICQPCRA